MHRLMDLIQRKLDCLYWHLCCIVGAVFLTIILSDMNKKLRCHKWWVDTCQSCCQATGPPTDNSTSTNDTCTWSIISNAFWLWKVNLHFLVKLIWNTNLNSLAYFFIILLFLSWLSWIDIERAHWSFHQCIFTLIVKKPWSSVILRYQFWYLRLHW